MKTDPGTAMDPGQAAIGGRIHEAILEPGSNCARTARADRLGWMIDGEECFAAIGHAIAAARSQILLLGWDFHSRVELWRDGAGPEGPKELVELLEAVVRKRPELRVHVLGWDYAAFYGLEREFLPRLRFGRATHRRIRFALDSEHPLLGSHHQKIVVVDDAVAFVGGFDLTAHRWDTRAHAPSDPRRKTPDGQPYGPFHDVQVAVSGPAACALGELARDRWKRATGKPLRPPRPRDAFWPSGLRADGEDLEVGIARTQPAHGSRAEVREVEQLYLDSIAAARDSIYIENQYLTCERVAKALAARLEEPDGPDVVIVAPRRASGWLEEGSMGVLRGCLLATLREADRHGRLRVLYPDVPGLGDDEIVNIHAKVMVVDDRFARVGSSNLSNRSMGLDTECDLALDASAEPRARPVVRTLRNELLGEHLGVEPDRVEEALASEGSLAAAVDALRSEGRTLRPLEEGTGDWASELLAAGVAWADPEEPISVDSLRDLLAGDFPRFGPRRALAPFVWSAAALMLVALTWLVAC